ncbi:flavin reductase family protein [Qipengyuania nanhaisediminis]|uniref:flavin reductase family protein n=1 Tax=Qipengyuania nanhaisediminis TaxID=604088 RepID=UPI0038B3DCDA
MPKTEPTEDQTSSDIRADFRKLMGLFATGVCVVAVPAGPQSVSAMTINSFVSVSLDPMLVCWSLQNDASQFDTYADADMFSVSILAERHAGLARRYAARGDTMLRPQDFIQSANGLPVIGDALGHLECRRWSLFPAGDHTMIFGEVFAMHPPAGNPPSDEPLGFFNGAFCSIGT